MWARTSDNKSNVRIVFGSRSSSLIPVMLGAAFPLIKMSKASTSDSNLLT